MIKINNKPALPSVCEACQLGKSKCLPFDLSANRSAEPSELIHCDLWPLLLLCLGLTINTMWVLLLTTVPGSYGAIHWRIKQIFLCIYSVWENGVYSIRKAYKGVSFWWWRREFKSEKLKRHFQNSGVLHKYNCPYTPQQAGVVERRHRSIVETGRTMLFHSKMPLKYWNESFQTTVFLHNKLPLKVLINNKSP